MPLCLSDLRSMSQDELFALIHRAAPFDPTAIEDSTYTGIDLSMPAWFHRLAWRYFRKTFHRDRGTGALRGWNVRVEQTGAETPPAPLRDRRGRPRTFGHYEVRSAVGRSFPRGWRGAHYLDYAVAGNAWLDWPARAGYCPLVAVNPGSVDLLLGWEVFQVLGLSVPLPDVWVLKREGSLAAADVVPRPDGARAGDGRCGRSRR